MDVSKTYDLVSETCDQGYIYEKFFMQAEITNVFYYINQLGYMIEPWSLNVKKEFSFQEYVSILGNN